MQEQAIAGSKKRRGKKLESKRQADTRWSKRVGKQEREQKTAGKAEGLAHPSVARCFGVAKPTFWRLEGCNLEL